MIILFKTLKSASLIFQCPPPIAGRFHICGQEYLKMKCGRDVTLDKRSKDNNGKKWRLVLQSRPNETSKKGEKRSNRRNRELGRLRVVCVYNFSPSLNTFFLGFLWGKTRRKKKSRISLGTEAACERKKIFTSIQFG